MKDIPFKNDVKATKGGGKSVFLNVLGRLLTEHVMRGGNDEPLLDDDLNNGANVTTKSMSATTNLQCEMFAEKTRTQKLIANGEFPAFSYFLSLGFSMTSLSLFVASKEEESIVAVTRRAANPFMGLST
jgi:hypothetical protein